MFIRFVSFLLLYLLALHAKANKCSQFNTPWVGIAEAQQASCMAVRDSKECQNLYSEIDKTSASKEEATYKKLKCDKKEMSPLISRLPDLALACAMGAVVDPIIELGQALGETAAAAKLHWSNARNCDKDLNQKMALIQGFNLDVPKLLRLSIPDKNKINSMSCNQIHVMILNHRTTQKNKLKIELDAKSISPTQSKNLTSAEKEYLDYINNPPKREGEGFTKLIEKIMTDLKIKHQCYSPEQLTKLYCEVAAFVASTAVPGLMALRAAKLAKTSGIKVEELLKYIGAAERKTAGIGGKFANSSEKMRVLDMAGNLSNPERIAAAEKLLGRTLSKEEREQLFKIHAVGADDKRGFFSYTKADIDLKRKLSNDINPNTGKPFFDLNDQKILMRNGITGIWGEEQVRIESGRKLLKGFTALDAGKRDLAVQTLKEGYADAGKYYDKYLNLDADQFKKSVSLGKNSTFDEDVSFFFPQAVVNGLPPDKVVDMAKTITASENGISKTQLSSKMSEPMQNKYVANLEGLEKNLKAEMDSFYELDKSGNLRRKFASQSQKDFKEYLLLESRLKLQEEAATVRYQNKYKEIDFDAFAEKDPVGFKAYQQLSITLDQKRKSLPKEWPYRGN